MIAAVLVAHAPVAKAVKVKIAKDKLKLIIREEYNRVKLIKESVHSQLDTELTNLVFLAAQNVDDEYAEITVQDVVDEIKRLDMEGTINYDDPRFQDYFVSAAREMTYEDVVDRMQELVRMGELNDDLEDFYSLNK